MTVRDKVLGPQDKSRTRRALTRLPLLGALVGAFVVWYRSSS